MGINVSLYTFDKLVHTVELAPSSRPPRQKNPYILWFGRESSRRAIAAGRTPHLPIDDSTVSRRQGGIMLDEDKRIIVKNFSEKISLDVRGWGTAPTTLYPHKNPSLTYGHVLHDGRGIIDILDTESYLVIGPNNPFEKRWSTAPLSSTQQAMSSQEDPHGTPGPRVYRAMQNTKIRDILLCPCRQDQSIPKDRCRSHETKTRQVGALVAGAMPTLSWPQTTRFPYSAQRVIGDAASALGMTPPRRSQEAAKLKANLYNEVQGIPAEVSDLDLLQWMIARRAISFDDISDLVERVSK